MFSLQDPMAGSQDDSIMDLLGPTISDQADRRDIADKLHSNKFSVRTLLSLNASELDDVIHQLFPEASLGLIFGFKTAIRCRKESLTQGDGLLTRQQWLRQTLQVRFPSFGAQPGSRGVSCPHNFMVDYWDIFPDIETYVARADSVDRIHPPVKLNVKGFLLANEALMSHHFWIVVDQVGTLVLGDKFGIQPNQSSSSSLRTQLDPSERAQSLASERVAFSDLVLGLDGRRFLVVEMKRASTFRTSVHGACPNLLGAFEDVVRGSPSPRSRALVEPVYQIFQYMLNMDLNYGIISSLDLSYFVRREGYTLLISQAITCDSSRFFGALAYILDIAANNPQVLHEPDPVEESLEDSLKDFDKDNSQSENPNDHSSAGKGKAKYVGSHSMNTRSRSGYDSLRETPAEHLHLAAHPFATGWSGRIVRGTYEGHPVVVKLAPFGSDRAEALLTEIMAYYKLKKYWGKYVPELVSYGTTAGGKVVYIATEVINGHEIGIGALTPEAVKATFDALNVVHESGILHGDIRCNNILVVKRGQGGVRLIDFGFSRPITSSEDCNRERAQLEYMLKQCSGSHRSRPNVREIGQLSDRGGIVAL